MKERKKNEKQRSKRIPPIYTFIFMIPRYLWTAYSKRFEWNMTLWINKLLQIDKDAENRIHQAV